MWEPSGDPGWKPVPWRPTGCDTEYATNLENAAPPMIWEDCGTGFPGCQRLVPIWSPKLPQGYPWALQAAPQVYKSGPLLRFSLHFQYGKAFGALDQRKVIYDETWKPVGAWREDECAGNVLQWTAKHACFAVVNVMGDTTALALLDPSNPMGAPIKVYSFDTMVPLGCTEDLFAAAGPRIIDLVSGSSFPLPPPAGGVEVLQPRLIGEYALLERVASGANGPLIDGWIWKRPNLLEKLVDPGSEVLYDLRSDGKTLVWIQTQSKDILESAPGNLWTSPFATSAAGVQATKRRAVPATSLAPYKRAGDGFYALVEQPVGSKDRFLHVYRLSDAHHWQVPAPADARPTDVVWIDSEEVWFTGTTTNDAYNTVIRQKLSMLGPGD